MKFYYSLFIFLLIAFAPFETHARIDIVPQKIVVDPRERSSEFTILNLFDQKGDFRIELINYRQNEKGVYEELKGPLDPIFDPKTAVRFSPRQFSIEAGGRQKVRLSIRKPADLPEGEYRFHIKALRFANTEEPASDRTKVAVHTNMGVVIPVMVRHGNVSSTIKITDHVLMPPEQSSSKMPEMHVTVARQGTASAVGRLEILWTPDGGDEKIVGLISNANIFTEINQRFFKVPLNEMPQGAGKIKIRYSDEVDKGKVLDEILLQR